MAVFLTFLLKFYLQHDKMAVFFEIYINKIHLPK